MAEMTRRDALRLAAAGAGAFLGGGPVWSQVRTRDVGEKSDDAGETLLDQIPQSVLRLAGLDHVPALPVDIPEAIQSLPRLLKRLIEQQPAKEGLSNIYTLAGHTETGKEFLFGEEPDDRLRVALQDLHGDLLRNPAGVMNQFYRDLLDSNEASQYPLNPGDLTRLSIESPEQWSISWTNFQSVYDSALPLLPRWAATMTDVTVAEEEFWPTIARYGVAYNLLVLQKVTRQSARDLQNKIGDVWTAEHTTLLEEGRLYAIDMSIFESLPVSTVDGFERFTPASITLLEQDGESKALRPILIRIAGENGAVAQTYTPATASASAWLYAMLAARTGITVYGIWLGHVYQWHIVTAAMLMTMHNELPRSHPVRALLSPQSKFLVGFDDVLLFLWRDVAPPTSVSTTFQFLQLLDKFADGRPFASDNPKQAIADLGLHAADFTIDPSTPWDQYPIVGYYLEIWDAAETYVGAIVDEAYANDRDVRRDRALQSWIASSKSDSAGNIHGLPEVTTKAALTGVLTSLIYRITVHGVSRLSNTANPAMAFIPNFPPCLQSAAIPDPTVEFNTRALLAHLPVTGTVGRMVTFYFTFAFTAPYVPFLPEAGLEAELFYRGSASDPRNQALIQFRRDLKAFIEKYQMDNPQLHQWPLNIET